MKRIILMFCVAGVMFFACNNEKKAEEKTAAVTETTDPATTAEAKEKEWVPVDSATAMKAWMEYGTPGEPHKMLAKSNGVWNGETTMWPAMGAPPATSKSTSTNKMVLDGRYQVSEFKGDFMGMPFNGMSTTAYDNHKKLFIATWVDNMGTGIMKMEGPWDEASRSMTLTGKYIDPATGRECEMKEILKVIDDNTQLMEMYGPDPQTGKQYKTMEIKLTRKK